MNNNIVGKKFYRLTIIAYSHSSNGSRMYLCKCDCGAEKIIRGSAVTSGGTQSCGCYRLEKGRVRTRIKHGLSGTPLYGVWEGMKGRCEKQSTLGFERYGGRGIKVCEEWKDASVFLKWAIDSGYRCGLSIDRIDNDGNYGPDNCKWSTSKEQTRNQYTNVHMEFNGETKILADWAEDFGINISTLRHRYWRGDRGSRLLRDAEHCGRGVTKLLQGGI